MPALPSRIGMLILIALLLFVFPTAAQENDNLIVVGSGIVTPLIEALVESANIAINTNITGTNAGFNTFCNGEADIMAAARPMSAAEQAACESRGVVFIELLLAHEIIAVIGSAESAFGQCLTQFDLDSLFAPSATATNWNQLSPLNEDIALTLLIPPADTTTYALLDTLVEGIGIRADAQTSADIGQTVASTAGAVGVVTLPEAEAAGDDITIFQLSTTAAGCTAPSAENVENRTYDAAYRLFAYVTVEALPAAQPIFNALYEEDGAALISERGLTTVTDGARSAALSALAGEETGRQFSRDVVAFTIPQNLTGALNIAGAATGANYIDLLTSTFVENYPTISITFNPDGEPDGIRRFCNGEVEMITSITGLNAEQIENCAANNVTPITLPLGSEAVVLVANESAEYLTCLSTSNIASLWRAADDHPNTWSEVSVEFPEEDIILFAPNVGSPALDTLVLLTTGAGVISRIDVEPIADPLLRAAATANVEGALALFTWDEYQRVINEGQAGIQTIAVNSEMGCVEPTLESISTGGYPLARAVNLLINEIALGRIEVQSIVWFMFSDGSYPLFSMAGLVTVPFTSLPDLRAELETTFARAAEAAAQAVLAEVTAESTPELSPEAGAEETAETETGLEAEATVEAEATAENDE